MKALVGTFNQEKALESRGLLRDCEIFANIRFEALVDIILHPRHSPRPRPPELEAAGAAVSGQQPDVVHARAAVVADVVASVQVARALAPPLPGLKTIILDKRHIKRSLKCV